MTAYGIFFHLNALIEKEATLINSKEIDIVLLFTNTP